MAAPTGQQVPTLWPVCDRWLRRATEVIVASADALDAMNVFPIADADTGTNLALTLGGITRAVPAVRVAPGEPLDLDGLVRAAISSAHGNSGAILAEMVTSVCRALERESDLRVVGSGTFVALLLRTVATAARRAVARPVDGTILSVAADAAAAADRALPQHAANALAVTLAAQTGARASLARTTGQLEALARAGVVDAGGQAFALLLDALVEVLGGPEAEALTEVGADRPLAAPRSDPPADYEVMYALHGAGPETLDQLRSRLTELGHSVVVVGDHTLAQVHVHLVDAGPAIEAGLEAGAVSSIRVTALPAPAAVRRVVVVVAGPGLAEAVASLGGTPVLAGALTGDDLAAWFRAAVPPGDGDLVVVPHDRATLEVTRRVAADLRRGGRRVAVIAAVAQVQALAALAVHEPAADFDSVVVAMSGAAGHVRHGAVTVAEAAAMTTAGRCRPGDVLGVLEGDVVEIGTSPAEVGSRVVDRLLAGGGELLTLVSGADAADGLVAEVAERARRTHPTLDVEPLSGGQPRYLLLVGLE